MAAVVTCPLFPNGNSAAPARAALSAAELETLLVAQIAHVDG